MGLLPDVTNHPKLFTGIAMMGDTRVVCVGVCCVGCFVWGGVGLLKNIKLEVVGANL